jgi:drug/metabolite transporter (DMT)-like permease
MKTIIEDKSTSNKSRTILGAFIVVIGAILLVDQLDLLIIPNWLFTWPMILIIIGLYSGAKHNFQNYSWLIILLVGVAFLADDALPGLMLSNFIWPAALIILGLYIIMRRGFRNRPKEL